MTDNKLLENIKKYRFEFKHLTVLFLVLVCFQIIISFIQKSSLQNFLIENQKSYQQFSAEKMANLSSTSLELLLENINIMELKEEGEKQKIIQSFNIIFNQQLLQHNVEEICLIVSRDDKLFTIDDGAILFNYLTDSLKRVPDVPPRHEYAVSMYAEFNNRIRSQEQIYSVVEGVQTFHIFVPFVPNGEYQGAMYLKITFNLASLTDEIIASYDEVALIYSSLILLGLLTMYYISSFTVKERDDAQKQLMEEHEQYIKEQIIHEKESLFTKRIYHTHHKAEKVMGFIKEDLRSISHENIDEVKYRVTKYSNFISRVIYDMKWYDPPLQTIRNQMFNTNLNEVIEFLLKSIFLRISSATDIFSFKLELDKDVPVVHINEFVVWEILEPLIQNCIDHSNKDKVQITIRTIFEKNKNLTRIDIADDGPGIPNKLLETDDSGIKNIFKESITTKGSESKNSGYGCYIAHQMATKRCRWRLDVRNNDTAGCTFTIIIPN